MGYSEDLAIEKRPKMRCNWASKSPSYFLPVPKHYKLYANGFFYDIMNDREEEHSIPADRRSAAEQAAVDILATAIVSMPPTNKAYDGKPAKSGRKNKVELPR